MRYYLALIVLVFVYNSSIAHRNDPTGTGIDFNGKKVAIFESYGPTKKFPVRITIPEYVNQVRAWIRSSGTYATDFVYELNSSQKEESGGYDIMIRYLCKFSSPLEYLIRLLGESKG